MNILYVSDSDTLSGAEVVLLHHVEHFRAPAHRAHVFLRERNTRLQQALSDRGVSFTATGSFSRRVVKTTFRPSSLRHFAQAFGRVSQQIRREVRKRDVDLVHSVSYPAALYAALGIWRSGPRQIWHEHNIKRLHRVNRPIYRFVASTCTHIVGPSDAVTANLGGAGLERSRLRTIYNGIDLERFTPDDRRAEVVRRELGLTIDQPAIGLFGQMLPHKGHLTLVEATALLSGEFSGLRCFFVGALENPPYQEQLRNALAARGLTEAVSFTGWRGDIPDVIRAMDIVVVATTTPEPAALTLMEAMAAGRPVVATATGGTPEIVADGQTGLLFAPGDAPVLAGHLSRLLHNPAERERLGQSGRRRAEERFSLGRHLKAIEQLYHDALADRAGRVTSE
jgi:glycosyltransferase involved in cell wall biosynthesis